MKTTRAALFVVTLALLAASAPPPRGSAQEKSPPSSALTESSYRRARAALDAGLRALGGVEALRAVEDFTLRETGRSFFVNQSTQADPPFGSGPAEETLVVDLKNNRAYYEVKNTFPGGSGHGKNYVSGAEGTAYDLRAMTATPINNPSIQNFRPQMRRLPHVLLLEALERAPTLRWLGEDTFRGRRQNVFTFIRADGRQASVYLDAETHLVSKYDLVFTSGASGDGLIEFHYNDYRDLGGIKVPRGRTLKNSGEVVEEREYVEVKINARPGDDVFQAPASGFTRITPPAQQQAGLVVEKLAEDVYVLRGLAGGNNNVLFVAFDDYVLVADAPEAGFFANTTQQVMAKIKETVPGRPIKYVVATHHHGDHSGGLRGYVAEGVTIVTTPGNRRYVERLLAAPFAVEPDALALRPRQPVFEFIEAKKRVFTDARHAVEVHDIGPNPHADELVVVYLPKEKILFQADLVGAAPGGPVNFVQDSTLRMAERIGQLGLDVERIVGAHGRTVTIAEFRAALDRRARAER